MKQIFFLIVLSYIPVQVWSQSESPEIDKFQIKIEPFEFGYTYPRLGLGAEKKFEKISLWGFFHYGWEGLANRYVHNHFDDDYYYWSVELGIKRPRPFVAGEYFFGGRVSYDQSGALIEDDVYYHISSNSAVLYDQAQLTRSRINLFIEAGHEFFIGKWFSIEYYAGIGGRRIENSYDDVENPFVLNDVAPYEYRKKSQYKYVTASLKTALIAGIRFGFSI